MKKRLLPTEVSLVLSVECQAGKTTHVLNNILDNLNWDHFFFTFDRVTVHEDAIEKFKVLAKGRNISPRLITKTTQLSEVWTDRHKGIYEPIEAILMGNISTFEKTEKLLNAEGMTGIPQAVVLDEVHRTTFGEFSPKAKQIDYFVNSLESCNKVREISLISATAHDVMYTDVIFSKKSQALTPYKGFYGLRDADWRFIEEKHFKELINNCKIYKDSKGRKSPRLPREIVAAIKGCENSALINVHHLTTSHEYIASKIDNAGVYNLQEKTTKPYKVGKNSMGVSETFLQSSMLYFTEISKGSSIAKIVQELGRVNGRTKPIIYTTRRIYSLVIDYLKFMDELVEYKIWEEPPEFRRLWLSSWDHKEPGTLSSPKHAPNRKVENLMRLPVNGTKDTCNEDYYPIYAPEIFNIPWTGVGIGKVIRDYLDREHPKYAKLLKNKTLSVNTETRQDGSLFRKHRERADARIGKTFAGYVGLVIRRSSEKGFSSFYDEYGYLLSDQIVSVGNVIYQEN